MKFKELLTSLKLTDEQIAAIMKELDGNYLPKSRFDEVNTGLKQAKADIAERDAQLETLKKSTGDTETLKKQITELQAANKTQAEAHAAELKKIKFDTALNSALTGAKARNSETVKPLLAAFLEKAELDDAGSIKGLDAEIKKLTESKETAFLFDTVNKPKAPIFKGITPVIGEEGNKPATLGGILHQYYNTGSE